MPVSSISNAPFFCMCFDHFDRRQRLLHRVFIYAEISFIKPSFLFQMVSQVGKKYIPVSAKSIGGRLPSFIDIITGIFIEITKPFSPRNGRIDRDGFVNADAHGQLHILVKNIVIKFPGTIFLFYPLYHSSFNAVFIVTPR